jgi:hypothetical protein
VSEEGRLDLVGATEDLVARAPRGGEAAEQDVARVGVVVADAEDEGEAAGGVQQLEEQRAPGLARQGRGGREAEVEALHEERDAQALGRHVEARAVVPGEVRRGALQQQQRLQEPHDVLAVRLAPRAARPAAEVQALGRRAAGEEDFAVLAGTDAFLQRRLAPGLEDGAAPVVVEIHFQCRSEARNSADTISRPPYPNLRTANQARRSLGCPWPALRRRCTPALAIFF